MNNKPVAWIPKDHLKEMGKSGFKYTGVSYQEDKFYDIPLYTHPVKELNDGGEPVKNATYWKRQHDNLLMKLNTCAIKVSELEKKLDIRTRELIGASFYEHDYKTLMAKPSLTDEEILCLAKEQYGQAVGLYNHIGFARAILRKAQEK